MRPTRYLQVDAHYEKVREGSLVIDEAVLIAIGIDLEGRREVIVVSIRIGQPVVASI